MQKDSQTANSTARGKKAASRTGAATGETLLKQANDAAHMSGQSAAAVAGDLKTSVVDAANEIGSAVADKAERVSREAADKVRTQAVDAAERGKSSTQKYVRSIGRALEAGSQSLEDDGLAGTAGYVRAAGRGLDGAVEEIGGLDAAGMTDRVEAFVRDRPLLTVGVLALAGFAIATTLKSTGSSAARQN